RVRRPGARGAPAEAEQALRLAEPTHVYHLAGYAHVGASFREPEAAWAGNLTATRRLLEAVARLAPARRPRVLFVGSGLIYGDGPAGRPPDEDSPPLPPRPPSPP